MITRVLDAQGRVLHDCTEAGCEVSWDGYHLAGKWVDANGAPVNAGTDGAAEVREGDPAEGRADLDTELWDVRGNVARQRA